MKTATISLFLYSAITASAADFTLSQNGVGPIHVHTQFTYEGLGERLMASATNDSGVTLPRVDFCFHGEVKGCLLTMSSDGPWEPGKRLEWNLLSFVHVPDLGHEVMIAASPAPVNVTPAPTAVQDAVANQSRTAGTRSPEVLTNETILKLSKAGLGDDLIIGMIESHPGQYSRNASDVIAMKEGGVSDKVIAAVLNTNNAASNPGSPRQTRIEVNSRLYIAPMEANLNDFIAAEIVKQKLPLAVVMEEKSADYVLTGLSQKTEVKWYDVVSGSVVGGKDRLEASAKLVRVKDRTFVWAGESGDRSLVFGALRRGGQRKLAERIVRKLKEDLF